MGGSEFEVKKVSGKPENFRQKFLPVFPKKPTAKNNGKPVKPAPRRIPPPSVETPIKEDTIKRTIPTLPPVVVQKDSIQLLSDMAIRKQTEQSRLVIDVDNINLKLYDNGIVDNDTVSVFYNGKLLLSHQRLSEKAVELNIKLDPTIAIHEITMYAENLGGIPPNTALVVVTAGNQRHELRSKASLEENAVMVFEYKKKE